MKKAPKKIGYYLTRLAVMGFFSIGILARCANIMMPEGGPKDSLPPAVVNMTPAFGTTNFTDKRVFIEFDEYVQLRDQMKEFYTSPFMKIKPTLLVRGRGIQIDISDTLLDNTTYALNFGSSIRDNNEGNPLNSFRYVFSTGPTVDSLVMSGYTVDAYKKDSVSKTFVLFFQAGKDSFPEYDSTLFKARADVVGRAENNGIFVTENLKPIPYRVYAMEDRNGNEMYDPGVDRVGFLDTVYNPAEMPGFNVWYDTTRMYISADPQLYFRLFADEQFKRQYFKGQSRPLQHRAIIHFGAPYPDIREMTFENIDADKVITEYLKPTRDSISLWFDIPAPELPDTIRGRVFYMKHDSLNVLQPDTQRLALTWKLMESKQQQKEREEIEKERQAKIDAGEEVEPEPNPFKFSIDAANPLNPEKNITFEFDYPLVSIDSAQISLVRTQEERRFRVRYRLEQDTMNIRKWTLTAPWQNGQNYSIEIPAGAFLNVAGQTNDTLKSEFAVMAPDDYGIIAFVITGKTPESKYVLQLLDESGNTMYSEIRDATSGTYTFRYLAPGKVRLRVVEDMNGNGEWDKGNLIERIQPERVEVFVQESGDELIEAKKGWEISFNIDMSKLFAPITMERVVDQINKMEQVRLKRLEEERLKRMESEVRNRNSSSGATTPSFGGFGGLGGIGGIGSGGSVQPELYNGGYNPSY